MIPVCAVLAIKAAIGISSTPYDGDSITYHLPMSIAYLQHHTAFPAQVMYHPGNAELFDALGLGSLGSIGGQMLTEAIVALVLLCSTFAVAIEMGADRVSAFAAIVAVVAIPIVGDQLLTGENDILVAALLLAVLALWRRFPFLSAIALGLLAGTKFTGALQGLALVVAIWNRRSPNLSWRHAGFATLVACPWYVRNALETGNIAFLGRQTSGFPSTIFAHLASAMPLVLSMFRNYGGLLSLLGFVAALVLARQNRAANRVVATVPLVIALALVAWVSTPNTAETAPGTLDQLRAGWSLRYAIFPVSLLTISSIVWLCRLSRSLGISVAILAIASTLLREYRSVGALDADSLLYVTPCLVAFALVLWIALCRSTQARTALAVSASIVFACTASAGSARIQAIWNERYEGRVVLGNFAFGKSLVNESVLRAKRTATIGRLQALPVVGSTFERFDVVDKNGLADRDWWLAVLKEKPDAILAGNVAQTDQVSAKEIFVRSSHLYRKSFDDGHVRIYVPQ